MHTTVYPPIQLLRLEQKQKRRSHKKSALVRFPEPATLLGTNHASRAERGDSPVLVFGKEAACGALACHECLRQKSRSAAREVQPGGWVQGHVNA